MRLPCSLAGSQLLGYVSNSEYLLSFGIKPFFLLFLTASVIRLVVAIAGISWFKEVRREVRDRSISQYFYQKVSGRALVEPRVYFFERRKINQETSNEEIE